MSHARVAILVLWLALLASFLVSGSTLAAVGRAVFGLLVVIHAIECVVFLPKLQRAPGSLAHHLAQTLVFGIVHVRDLETSEAR